MKKSAFIASIAGAVLMVGFTLGNTAIAGWVCTDCTIKPNGDMVCAECKKDDNPFENIRQ